MSGVSLSGVVAIVSTTLVLFADVASVATSTAFGLSSVTYCVFSVLSRLDTRY